MLWSLQTPCRPSAFRGLFLEPELAAPHLLPVCSDLQHPTDSGQRGSLPAFAIGSQGLHDHNWTYYEDLTVPMCPHCSDCKAATKTSK